MKRVFIITIAIIATLLCILVAGLYLFVLSGAFAIFMPEPPEPQIKYGEFPFRITYEVNGEARIYEDSVVCEYAGIENLGTNGKRWKWTSYLKSGNPRVTLVRAQKGDITYEISCMDGHAEYYMGDFRKSKSEYEYEMTNIKYLGYDQWENGVRSGKLITKEEAFDEFQIKIISREYSSPIQNFPTHRDDSDVQ